MEKTNHFIGIKYESMVAAILLNVKSEKQAVFILNELFSKYNLFNPRVTYLGKDFVEQHYSYLIDNHGETYLVCINKNSNLLKVINLYGKLEDFSYYVSVLDNTLTVIYDNYLEEIQINLKEATPIVTWNYNKIK
jgi:hypothetical protein